MQDLRDYLLRIWSEHNNKNTAGFPSPHQTDTAETNLILFLITFYQHRAFLYPPICNACNVPCAMLHQLMMKKSLCTSYTLTKALKRRIMGESGIFRDLVLRICEGWDNYNCQRTNATMTMAMVFGGNETCGGERPRSEFWEWVMVGWDAHFSLPNDANPFMSLTSEHVIWIGVKWRQKQNFLDVSKRDLWNNFFNFFNLCQLEGRHHYKQRKIGDLWYLWSVLGSR